MYGIVTDVSLLFQSDASTRAAADSDNGKISRETRDRVAVMAAAHASCAVSDTFDPYGYTTLSYEGSKARLVVTEDDLTRATADWKAGKITTSNLLKVSNMHKFPMEWVSGYDD